MTQSKLDSIDLSRAFAFVECKKIRENTKGNAAKTIFGAIPGILVFFPGELVFYDENADVRYREKLDYVDKIYYNPTSVIFMSDRKAGFVVQQNVKKMLAAAAIGGALGFIVQCQSAKGKNFGELLGMIVDEYPGIKLKRR